MRLVEAVRGHPPFADCILWEAPCAECILSIWGPSIIDERLTDVIPPFADCISPQQRKSEGILRDIEVVLASPIEEIFNRPAVTAQSGCW